MDGAGSYSVAHRAGHLPTELTGMWGWTWGCEQDDLCLVWGGGGGRSGRVPSEEPCGWRWVLLSCPSGGAPSY